MAITKEDVFAAADQVAAEGGNPSQINVRKRLGSGSHTTIGQYLVEWRAKQEAIRVSNMLRTAAPQELIDRFGEMANEIWRLAIQLAENRTQTEHKSWQAEIKKKSEMALQDAANHNEKLRTEIDTLKEALMVQTAKTDAAEELNHLLGSALKNALGDEGSSAGDLFGMAAAKHVNCDATDGMHNLQSKLQIVQDNLIETEAKVESLQEQLVALTNNRNQSTSDVNEGQTTLAVADACVKTSTNESWG